MSALLQTERRPNKTKENKNMKNIVFVCTNIYLNRRIEKVMFFIKLFLRRVDFVPSVSNCFFV